MFVRAVDNHGNVPHVKNSQGPNSRPSSIEPLSTSSSATLNTLNGLSAFNPLKRNASQLESGQSSQPDRIKDRRRIMQSIPNSAARMEKLQFDFGFDEDDFEDDEDINLDEIPAPTASKTTENWASSATVTYPTLPSASTVSYPILPNSSDSLTVIADSAPPPVSSNPLPWSSSPPEHAHLTTAKIKAKEEAKKTVEVEQETRIVKRGKLPWQKERSDQKTNKHESGISLNIPEYVRDQIADARYRKSREAFQTPNRSRVSDITSYPWNTTASAFKAEQKKMRQDQRKQAKTIDRPGKGPKRAKETVSPVFLSEEQKQVLHLVADVGKSVFFTGPAGTGKSVLLKEIIAALRTKYRREPDRVAVTASTGLAACNIGGVTLHSFAGIGLGKEPAPELVKKIKRNQKSKNRWLRTKVLIIDEISMVDGELFDKLEEVARSIRNNGRPFGGIKLVITGDFFQLPPVPGGGRAARFSFDAATWNTSIEHTIGLTNVFRQKDPGESLRALSEKAVPRLTDKHLQTC